MRERIIPIYLIGHVSTSDHYLKVHNASYQFEQSQNILLVHWLSIVYRYHWHSSNFFFIKELICKALFKNMLDWLLKLNKW